MSNAHQRRQMILAAAERLLEHYGLNKTTIADIAREASVGVGSVYLEFGSKDDIIGQVAGAKHRMLLERLEATASSAGSAKERLRALLDTRIRLFREFASCGTHAQELVHCRRDAVQSSWHDYKRAEHALVRRVLVEGVEECAFDVADPDSMATSVLDAYAVFAPPWPATAVKDFEPRLAAMHDLVLRGLRR